MSVGLHRTRGCHVRALLVLLLLGALQRAAAQVPDTTRSGAAGMRDNWTEPLDIISLGGTFMASSGEGSFFKNYAALGGTTGSLDATFAPSLAVRLHTSSAIRLVIQTMAISTGFDESYYVTGPGSIDSTTGLPMEGPPLAIIDETFSLTAIPLMAGVEIRPVISQFATYIGLVAGAAYVGNTWKTESHDVAPTTYHRPRTNVEGPVFVPAAQIFTGVDMRFDRFFSGRSAFRGIFLEAAYTYLPVTRPYFSEVIKGGRGIETPPPTTDATVYAGGISVTLGINLQFLRGGH